MEVVVAITGAIRFALRDAGLRNFTVVDLPNVSTSGTISVTQGPSKNKANIFWSRNSKQQRWWYELSSLCTTTAYPSHSVIRAANFDIYTVDIEDIIAIIVEHMINDCGAVLKTS